MMATRATDALPIAAPGVLAVEGDDEFYLLKDLRRREGLGKANLHLHNLQGRDGLIEKLKALARSPGFREVRSLGVMIDAETGSGDNALQKVAAAIDTAARDLGWPAAGGAFLEHGATVEVAGWPCRVGAFIAPDGASPGMLEDLCLRGVAGNPVLERCVTVYVECLAREGVSNPDSGKRRLYAFLASCDEPGLRLGQAAYAGCWNFDHECWDPLKQFLCDLACTD